VGKKLCAHDKTQPEFALDRRTYRFRLPDDAPARPPRPGSCLVKEGLNQWPLNAPKYGQWQLLNLQTA
jgi:hypothetical protein